MNPNNCQTCNYKSIPDGGFCYMFRDEPGDVCMQHTGRDPRRIHEAIVSAAMGIERAREQP